MSILKVKKIQVFLFATLMAAIALGQLQRIQLTTTIAFYVHDLIISSWLVLLLYLQRARLPTFFKQVISKIKKNWSLAALLGVVVIGWGNSVIDGSMSWWSVLFFFRLSVYLSWAGLVAYQWKKQLRLWQTGFISSGLLILWFGFIQYLFIPDTRFLSVLGWDDHYYRLISTVFDPNFAGIILTIVLLWLLDDGLLRRWSRKWDAHLRKLRILFITLLLVGIGLTFSRASYLSLVMGLITYLYLSLRNKKLSFVNLLSSLKTSTAKKTGVVVITAVGLLITFGFYFSSLPLSGEGVDLTRTTSIEARIKVASRSITSLNNFQWLLGRGLFIREQFPPAPNRLDYPDHAQFPSNIIVLAVTQLGLVGTAVLISILLKSRKNLTLSKSSVAIIVAVLIHSMFNNTIFQPFVLLMILGKGVEEYWLQSKTKI
jgi:hypothetical protein